MTTFVAVYSGSDISAFRRCIYGLIDPRQPERVMYVGKTNQYPLTRLDGHISEARRPLCPCHHWVAKLIADGELPNIAVLEVVALGDDLEGAEQAWIRHYRYEGQAELNRNIRLRAQLEAELAEAIRAR